MPNPPAVLQSAESVTMIPIGNVHPAPDNPRKSLGDLTELVESIKAQGILQPLVVTPDSLQGHYMVVLGHRRRGGGELAELKWLPCIIRAYDQAGRMQAMLVENLQREDLTALEEAEGFQKLADTGLSQRDISARIGRSQGYISRHLALLQLPENARASVDSGEISKEVAFELTKVDNPAAIEQALSHRGRSNYADVASHARGIADQLTSEAARKVTRDAAISQGVTIIGEASGSHMAGPYYPGALLSDLERRHAKFDVKAHEKLKCDGIWIGWDGKPHAACADAMKHQPASRQPKRDPEVEARQRELERSTKRWEELGARRGKHIQLLLDGKLGADARDHVVRMAIYSEYPEWDDAAKWLGIKWPDDDFIGDDRPESVVGRWVAEAPSTRQLQAALAMVLDLGERALAYARGKHLLEDAELFQVRHHCEFLTFSGFQLAPEEEALLVAPEPKEAEPDNSGLSGRRRRRGTQKAIDRASVTLETEDDGLDPAKQEQADERAARRADLFGADGWGGWETGSTHPVGATKDCQPTIEERMWDWGREAETPATGHLEYRGACRGCDWRGAHRTMQGGGENAAVEDAHDHAFPGWWDLPALTTKGARPDNPSKNWAEAAVKQALDAGYPADFVARRGPIRELRGGIGTRHVPGYSPFGGYALAVMVAEPMPTREDEGDEPPPTASIEQPLTEAQRREESMAAAQAQDAEEDLPEPQPCPVCKRMVCAHSAYEKHQATSGVTVS